MKDKRKTIFIIISIVFFLLLICLVCIALNSNNNNKSKNKISNNSETIIKDKNKTKNTTVNNQEKQNNKKKSSDKKKETKKDIKETKKDNGAGKKSDVDTAIFACPSGYTSLDGNNITYTTICVKSLPAEEKCDSGYVILDGKCKKEEQFDVCDDNYIFEDEYCYSNSCESLDECEDKKDATCLEDEVLSSEGKCIKSSIKDIKYSCDSLNEKGFILSGSTCNKYTKAMKQ